MRGAGILGQYSQKDFVEAMRAALKEQLFEFETAKKAKDHKAKTISTEGPKKWSELKDCVKSYIEEINEGVCEEGLLSYSQVVNDNEMTVRHELNGRDFRIVFDSSSAKISYSGERGEGEFLPHVKGDTLGYEWKGGPLQEVLQRKPRRIYLGDDLGHDPPQAVIPTSQMAEIILRCVVES